MNSISCPFPLAKQGPYWSSLECDTGLDTLPPLGHSLVVLQRHPQLLWLMSLQAPPLSADADWHQVQMGSSMLLHEPCCYMQTPLVGASWPNHLVGDLQRLGDMPLSLGSHILSGHWSGGGRKWTGGA